MVFVVATPGVYTNGMHGVAMRRVMAWSELDGFHDVTALFPDFVRKKVISSLKKEMALENDPEKRTSKWLLESWRIRSKAVQRNNLV